ncbi:MAG: 2-dehydro-3-deoxy-6-phosphogalactonate aldolase [Burkholderiales bacterium]
MNNLTFNDWLRLCPLVSILRGVRPDEAVAIGEALVEADFRIIEVPLNSPDPFDSIARLSKRFGSDILIGAGTVIDARKVSSIADAGGRLVVLPHADERVVKSAKALGLFVVPGFATPTEAFKMIEAGSDALKLFPAEANPPNVLRALRAVLPREMPILPVGGITSQNMTDYWQAGADGFGLGSALYKPGNSVTQVASSGQEFRAALEKLPKR